MSNHLWLSLLFRPLIKFNIYLFHEYVFVPLVSFQKEKKAFDLKITLCQHLLMWPFRLPLTCTCRQEEQEEKTRTPHQKAGLAGNISLGVISFNTTATGSRYRGGRKSTGKKKENAKVNRAQYGKIPWRKYDVAPIKQSF